jgi:hypothetical protein
VRRRAASRAIFRSCGGSALYLRRIVVLGINP